MSTNYANTPLTQQGAPRDNQVMNRMTVAVVSGAVTLSAVFLGATITASTAGADPWKCESGNNCFWNPGHGPDWGDIPGWGNIPNWQNALPWGHLPEGWH
jgi:hypothetical protein